jgi:hypothetical protein
MKEYINRDPTSELYLVISLVMGTNFGSEVVPEVLAHQIGLPQNRILLSPRLISSM